MRLLCCTLVLGTLLCAATAQAAKFRIGEPVARHGMSIAALYLQAVKMDMGQHAQGGHHGSDQNHHAGAHPTSGDLHLEAAVEATADNDWGFPEGAWIPYLTIEWTLTKKGSDWSRSGTFLPMAASDGPHYGDNLDLDGPGKYRVTYRINPPDPSVFPRHFDKETGVSKWWDPFEVSWEFVFTGTGKKGGY